MLLKKALVMVITINLLANNMTFAVNIQTSGIESITIVKDYTIEKRKAVGGEKIFDSVKSYDMGTFTEELTAVWVNVQVRQSGDSNEVKGIYAIGEENSIFADPSQNNFHVEGEIRLIRGKNTIEIVAIFQDDTKEEYVITITIGEESDGKKRHSSALAVQGARIISTDVGSAFLAYENESDITIDERYKAEIITKANGLRNFTVNTYASENPGSVKFTKALLEKLKKDSKITELQVKTLLGSVKVRIDDLLDKGDIKVSITKTDKLIGSQEYFISGEKMYCIEIFSIIDNDITKLSKFEHNVEIVLPYTIAGEDPLTLTMYSINEEGKANNLRGTYDGGVYAFVKEIIYPIIGQPNVIEFSDIKEYSWAEDFIKECAAKNIICGRGNHIYSPADNITRAEFITLLIRTAGIEPVNDESTVFSDISKDLWYYKYVITAKQLGLVKGTSNSTFSPDEEISREDMIVMIINLLEYIAGKSENIDENDFTDSYKISEYAKDAVNLARQLKVIEGYEDSTFRPNTLTSRAEAATIIIRVFKLINRFYIEELFAM